ncbi:uncharacterized protein LACBIDRAFT_328544 [Laccaria bicolor S238N-H82]|uniref:Predicted protein n=1 Tax=Laccaria bicolor (strain S238N-H82 / ATCC MYA-4686) TaxID=486041 RepID=B0DF82_LACBS|nr:uncharacterized protein LACBIDRAFT_328544 [Laccaria bicolor S238N-H82]EDR06813.1 predicted protein [Laccaria bicolor S238N-H82]|eukprot:XP_001882660.1 predicted protein [Laccaria bicolor S238N-H82]
MSAPTSQPCCSARRTTTTAPDHESEPDSAPSPVKSPKPKKGQKRFQSNADEGASKRKKKDNNNTNTNTDNEAIDNTTGGDDMSGELGRAARGRGRGGKAKAAPSRGKGGKRGGKGKTSVEKKLEEEGTTVAPPEHHAQSLTSSYLPPAPSISSSCVQQEHEPITKGKSGMSKDSEDFSDQRNSSSDNEEKSSSPSPDYSTIKIGPPVGRHCTMPTKSIVPQREVDTDIPMASPDQERVTSTTQLEKAKPKIKALDLANTFHSSTDSYRILWIPARIQ